MAKTAARAEVNSFIAGLITEASPLNYPPNASLDEENFELNRNGTRDRRLGIGFESGYNLVPLTLPVNNLITAKVASFKWINVAGNVDNEFLVVQVERYLKFFDLSQEAISGAAAYLGEIELASFPVGTQYSFTSLEGLLIVVAGVDTIAQITYTGSTFTVSYERLQVRDSWGVEVTGIPAYETDKSYRGAYDEKHYYNLQNQSWGIPRKNQTNVLIDPSEEYNKDLLLYPSNSETVWAGLQFQPVASGVTFERVYTNLYTEVLGTDVLATKGYYTIDLLRRGQSRMDAFAANNAKHTVLNTAAVTLPADITSGGAQIVAQFAGRAWYAGFNGEVTDGDSRSPNLDNFITFSQLVRNKTDFYKCYQEGDPSSRDNTDIVDTDGGFVRVLGANKIIAMLNLESHLVIVAENGVWTLAGGSDYGFSATNYKLTKLSSFGGLSASSIVIEGGRAFYWSESGIYAIAKDKFGQLIVTNITESTIQTYFENIDNTSKIDCIGTYDPIGRKIRWVFKEGTRFGSDSVTSELVLDTVLTAFYRNKIGRLSTNTVEVVGAFASLPFKRGTLSVPVFSGVDEVFSSADAVTIDDNIRSSGIQSVRYIVLSSIGGTPAITFAYANNLTFTDWKEADGVGMDAKAYLLTGQQTAGDSAVQKQIPYLVMHFKRTEEGVTAEFVPDKQSSCFMRCQWDFANTINSRKWSSLVQVYRYRQARYVEDLGDDYDTGFELITTKNKLRGRGKAFSLYLETEPLKDCRVYGWSITLSGGTNV